MTPDPVSGRESTKQVGYLCIRSADCCGLPFGFVSTDSGLAVGERRPGAVGQE